jgi:hypothetical protein
MHSIGSMSARRTSIARPATSSISAATGGSSAGSVATRCVGAIPASWPAKYAVIAVSTRPLSGTGSAKTRSKAEILSDATMSSRPSPTS